MVVWQVAFLDRRLTKLEGVLGVLASLTCAALNVALLLDGEWAYPIVVATIYIMVSIMMIERPGAEARARDAMRKLGPLQYIGKAPIEQAGSNESLPP